MVAATVELREARLVGCRPDNPKLWPTLTQPLRSRDEARRHVGRRRVGVHDRPADRACDPREVASDLVRGVMATDALIGTFARADDPTLKQNVCFLYHLMGGGTGDWDVPVGGMGAVSGALAAAAAGQVPKSSRVQRFTPSTRRQGAVSPRRSGTSGAGRFVLANVTPVVLARLLGEPAPTLAPGAQVKVNLMLQRLPRLRDDSVTPEQAFGGTFHINETFSQLDTAYTRAEHGVVPDPLPCEIYCHSLTDPSILSDRLRETGAQTLTVFGLHTPHGLIAGGRSGSNAGRLDVRGAELAEFRSCRTDSRRADGRYSGSVVHRSEDHRGSGADAGDDGRQHLPRRVALAVRGGRRAARHARRDAGAWRRLRPNHVVRLGIPPRWCGVGHRRTQCRHGGAGKLRHRRAHAMCPS